jgi:phasin protein
MEVSMANTKAAQSAGSSVNFPFAANADWLKSFADGPMKFYTTASKEALGLTASLLQDQADYVKRLADCTDPADALKCQWEFAQKAWSRSSVEASKFFGSLRPNGGSSSS